MKLDIEHVSLDNGLDLLGTIRIFECVKGVFIGCESRRDISDHHCATVPTQTVFQETGQFGVAIGDMLVLGLCSS